ncbi:MAG: hypothetical protein GX037_00030, partial [Trueperella sp.]|nr:hypothetical protein [Trueperella sp.]
FTGVVVDRLKANGEPGERGVVSIADPALEAVVSADHVPVGERVRVRLVSIGEDLTVHFELIERIGARKSQLYAGSFDANTD